jgi:predicted dehydrogenase
MADLDLIAKMSPLPRRARPIVSIGAGKIVRDAHLPAYRLAGFAVESVFDLDLERARALARDFGIPRVCTTLAEAVASAPRDAVFDLALPARAVEAVLAELPDGAAVLIQKPLGETLEEARRLRALCRKKALDAAVNFQLRFAPNVLAARELVERGMIGELCDVEVRVTCATPWQIWTFLRGIPRMEILYHSIHYVDLVRSFAGEPHGVHCLTVKHPKQPELASTRTAIALDYGEFLRATITTNHGHDFGLKHQESYLKLEGTRGAVRARLGVNLDYPRGLPDEIECVTLPDERGHGDSRGAEWRSLPLAGNWFPHAFIGTMASLMRYANGETSELPTAVDDAFRTMAVVEACYRSSASGATEIEEA